jgi:hypothetical protein
MVAGMDRRMLIVMAGATVAIVLVVLAASSGPVRLWSTPSSDTSGPSIGGGGQLGATAPNDPVPTDGRDRPPRDSTLLQVVGTLLMLLAATAIVRARRSWVGLRYRPGVRRERTTRRTIALPERPEREMAVDVDAARSALAEGNPRNAIVACWMQLERDAAGAGLPRAAADTSTEYIERVVAASSVDPAPIGELAAIYREARFSRHELRDDHRTRALAALNRVAAALRHSVDVPT